jgi:hypothetical protein
MSAKFDPFARLRAHDSVSQDYHRPAENAAGTAITPDAMKERGLRSP